MGHEHSVIDSDRRFIIDPIKRTVKSEHNQKIMLMQYDHNSERFTFQCPKTVEGHDMSECSKIQIHFLNVDANTRKQKKGLYEVDDLTTEDDNVVFSWLIKMDATQLVGSLAFIITFLCETDGVVDYRWSTSENTDMTIGSGINADESFEKEYSDIIYKWKESVMQTFYADLNAWKAVVAKEVREEAFADITVQKERIDKLSNYVTPEMFGAKGDGETDDTDAFQSALNTGRTVLLAKTYCIETITAPMGASIIVNGALIVNGTINICYPNIKFSGSGVVKCVGAVCFTLKGAGNTDKTYCKNFHIGEELTVYGEMDKNNTGFLITADEGTNGVVVYPEINCKIHSFKYGIHSLYSGTDEAWFTSLRCRSLIENCRYAIILDWHGTGSVYDGVIQPLVVSNPATDDIPLIKIGNNCTVRCVVWDMATAPNKYAVYAVGTYNTINVPNYAKYVYCKEPSENHVEKMANRHFNVSSTFCQGSELQPVLLPYNNTNDLAINAGNNKVGLSVTPSILAGSAKSLLSGVGAQSIQWYFDTSHAPDDVVLVFDFPINVALRQIFVCGSKLPDSVKFEYKNTSGEWVHLKTCINGEDFKNTNGKESYAWWQFVYSYPEFTFQKKFATGVRITMNTETSAEITRIHIGAVNVTMPTKMGDDLIATSFKIKGKDGKFYDISVQNGELVATAEN